MYTHIFTQEQNESSENSEKVGLESHPKKPDGW